MARHRSHGVAFKRQAAQEFLARDMLHGLARRHDLSLNLVRPWVQKYEAGVLDKDAAAGDTIQEYEARIAALERLVGRQALELEFSMGAFRSAPPRSGSMPHVATPEMARRVVEQCKFPPLGRRSLTGGLPQLSFAAANDPPSELVGLLNDNLILVVMLESGLAIENAEAIAAVPGIDVLYIGTNDLAADLGLTGQLGHERIVAAYERVVAACRRHGRIPNMAGVYDHALMQRYVGMGARFLQGGVDLAFMIQGTKARADFLRTLPLEAART